MSPSARRRGSTTSAQGGDRAPQAFVSCTHGDEEELLRIRRAFFASGLGKLGAHDDKLRQEIQDEIDRIDQELAVREAAPNVPE